MIDLATFKQFQITGKVLTDHRYNTSHSGNISMRAGGKILIKRRGAMLGYLEPEDIIETDLYNTDSGIMLLKQIYIIPIQELCYLVQKQMSTVKYI
jgi:ribulose-5-phosphate 4-epimerase/fuculose-1-phosphate aldolase